VQIGSKEEMTLSQACQWIIEHLKSVEDKYAVTHSAGVCLYIYPIDEEGKPVEVRGQDGRPVTHLPKRGRYKPATEEFNI
jgi:hypothetical protein